MAEATRKADPRHAATKAVTLIGRSFTGTECDKETRFPGLMITVNARPGGSSFVPMYNPAVILAMATMVCASAAGAQAHPGIGIVSDSRGNVFYTDLHQVLRIDTAGRVSVAVPRVHT